MNSPMIQMLAAIRIVVDRDMRVESGCMIALYLEEEEKCVSSMLKHTWKPTFGEYFYANINFL